MRTALSRRIVWVLAISASLTSSAVYSFADPADLSSVFGAQLAGCKGPCNDGGMKSRAECLDETGPPCDTAFCTLNEYHLATCTVGVQGPEDPPCKTKVDPNDWYRRSTVRAQSTPCDNQGRDREVFPACTLVSGGAGAWNSPCKAGGGCSSGPIQLQVTYAGRTVCDK